MVIALLLVGAAIVWGIIALVRRQQYIGSIRQRGWSFVNSPTFDAVARLSNPPFGLGFVRQPDDQITGLTEAGRPFQVIEYKSAYWSGWVGMVTLSRRLPELWITGGETAPRYGVLAHGVPAPPQLGPGAPFRIEGDWVWFTPGEHSQPAIAGCSAYLRGFLGRVPRFVWRNLGLPDTPYPALETTVR
jgi:hypothetical protein